MYKITYRKQAVKALAKMPKPLMNRFQSSFHQLASCDTNGLDIKKLEGREGYRLRIGDYRALYRIINVVLTIEVVKIGNRGDAYK